MKQAFKEAVAIFLFLRFFELNFVCFLSFSVGRQDFIPVNPSYRSDLQTVFVLERWFSKH